MTVQRSVKSAHAGEHGSLTERQATSMANQSRMQEIPSCYETREQTQTVTSQ